MASSPALEEQIRERAEKLEHFGARITDCHVVVHAPHHHQRTAEIYTVRIDLHIPGAKVVVNRDPSITAEHADVHVAVRDAFDAVRRRIEDQLRRRRGDVKQHEAPLWGRVLRLDTIDGFGFLEAPDGLQVYFHENAVVAGKFGDLRVGSEVRFSLEDGELGPQASSVEPIGKHHVVSPR